MVETRSRLQKQGEEWWRVVKSEAWLFTLDTICISVTYAQNVKSEE